MADNYPMDLPLALGRRWRVAHNSTGSTTTNKAFERRGSWAGSMRQQEHLDEATAACWVTFCSEAIRTKVLIVAQHRSEFGVPGASRGASAFPQLRFAALVENGTHVLFGARLGPCATGETTLAREVLAALRPGMLCLADRQFFGYALWRVAKDTGADLLWRVKHNLRLPREAALADGSYLTTVYPSDKDRRHRIGGVRVRVVEYRLEGGAGAEPLYRLGDTDPRPDQAPPGGTG